MSAFYSPYSLFSQAEQESSVMLREAFPVSHGPGRPVWDSNRKGKTRFVHMYAHICNIYINIHTYTYIT